MDTLRLAINYIQFLKDLVESSKLEDNEGGERKVVISCTSQVLPTPTSPPVIGHSLSWKRHNSVEENRIKTTSIWIPEKGVVAGDG